VYKITDSAILFRIKKNVDYTTLLNRRSKYRVYFYLWQGNLFIKYIIIYNYNVINAFFKIVFTCITSVMSNATIYVINLILYYL